MQGKPYRYLWLIAVLVLIAVACSLFSAVGNRIDTARATAEAIATDVEQGRDLLETARAMATQVGGAGMLGTIQALATEADESGLLSTAQAFATAEGPGLMETALAVATRQGPEILSTAQSYITQIAPGEAPADIPIMDGDKELFFQSKNLVSYMIALPLEQVDDFYQQQMPANGWTKVDAESFESPAAKSLVYEKPGQRASVVLSISPGGDKSVILITIETR
jgi:hypothetical protein